MVQAADVGLAHVVSVELGARWLFRIHVKRLVNRVGAESLANGPRSVAVACSSLADTVQNNEATVRKSLVIETNSKYSGPDVREV